MRGPRKWPTMLAAVFSFCLLAFTGRAQNAAAQIGREVAIPHHLQEGDEYKLSIPQLIAFGEKLFTARWRVQEGAVPHVIRNEFGGYVGGPVVIPHVYRGRDKTFWFFDYAGLREHKRGEPFYPFVPTPAMWNGDLSNAVDPSVSCDPAGPNCTPFGYAPITIYDPTTTDPNTFQRQPFPNNQIPGPFTALPTNNNNPFIAPNFLSTYPDITRTNTYTIKVDQNFTDKDRLSVRYTNSWLNAALEGGYFANPIDTSSGMGTSARDYYIHNVAVNYTRTISTTWLNELLVGVNRSAVHYGTSADSTNWPSKLGMPNPFNATGWPTMYTCEAPDCTAFFGWDSDNVHNQNLTSETIDDNATWTHGKHTIQFGFRGRREQNNVRENQQAQGNHEWDYEKGEPERVTEETWTSHKKVEAAIPIFEAEIPGLKGRLEVRAIPERTK